VGGDLGRGRTSASRAIEQDLLDGSSQGDAGYKDAAFADLAQLDRRRDPLLIGVLVDPSFANLHGDARFNQLIASVGLPQPRH
jgi:hypothetical protein